MNVINLPREQKEQYVISFGLDGGYGIGLVLYERSAVVQLIRCFMVQPTTIRILPIATRKLLYRLVAANIRVWFVFDKGLIEEDFALYYDQQPLGCMSTNQCGHTSKQNIIKSMRFVCQS